MYRVVAVVVAAAITAVLLVLMSLPWWVAVPVGAALWIVPAVVQEHDERVPRPVNAAFVHAVRERVEPVLAAAGFTFNFASGGQRARRDSTDVSSTRLTLRGTRTWGTGKAPVSTCGSVEMAVPARWRSRWAGATWTTWSARIGS